MSILDSVGSAEPVLDERYGKPPRWSRLVVGVVVALLATAGVAWVIWAGLAHSNPPVSAQLQGYEVRNAHETDVTLVLDRSEGDAVQCQVYAEGQGRAIVGERTIDVPAGEPGITTRTVTIATDRRAVSGALRSCEVTDSPS